MKLQFRRWTTFLFLLLSFEMYIFGNQDFIAVSKIDWSTGVLELQLSKSTRQMGQNPASAATTVTRSIHNVMPVYMLSSLLDLRVDSHRLLSDFAREQPELLRDLEKLAENAQAKPARISTNLEMVTVPFTLNIFPSLTELLVKHQNPSPLEQVFQWQGSGQYTGLVIYAAEELPVRGETERGRQSSRLLYPSIFLRIFDPDLNVIVEPNRTDPSYLVEWGSVGYTTSFDESPYRERIGNNPLRISGNEIFGIFHTDLIISEQARNILLFSSENRRILQEGRILIIIHQDKINESIRD